MKKIAIVTDEGHIAVKSYSHKSTHAKASWKDWWLIKHGTHNVGTLVVNCITLPKKYIGKRVRLKVEVIKDEPMEKS